MREFCKIVEAALDQLPEQFHSWLENVVVDVELEPDDELLESLGIEDRADAPLGIFQGLEVTEQEFGEHAPNRIVLFKRPIEAACHSREEIEYEIRRTVVHELAHHFGYSEEDLDDFESQPSPFDDAEEA